jgi:hypothetical protein
MGEIKFVGSLLMFAVFGLSLLMFGIGFGEDNNTSFNIGDSEGWNTTRDSVNSNLTQFHTDVISSSESFYKSEIQEGETVKTGGQFKLGPATALSTTTTFLGQGFRSIFGNNSAFGVVLTALLSFLGFVLVLYIWKTWAGRNPN